MLYCLGVLKNSNSTFADVAESADAPDSGSGGSNTVWVQVPSSAPKTNPHLSLANVGFLLSYI